jgi:acyl carrier protein
MSAASYESVLSETVALIARHSEPGTRIVESSRFDSDLNFDSIQVMDLVADIEDHFDVTIPLNDLPKMQTVEQTARRLVELASARR